MQRGTSRYGRRSGRGQHLRGSAVQVLAHQLLYMPDTPGAACACIQDCAALPTSFLQNPLHHLRKQQGLLQLACLCVWGCSLSGCPLRTHQACHRRLPLHWERAAC